MYIARKKKDFRRFFFTLVADNPEQIEGKVNGQQLVLLTKFVKKST